MKGFLKGLIVTIILTVSKLCVDMDFTIILGFAIVIMTLKDSNEEAR